MASHRVWTPKLEPRPVNRIAVTAGKGTCLPPNTRVGGYVLTFFRSGGMSQTYLARRAEKTYFVKEAPSAQAEVLRKEYQTLRELQHPRIVVAHRLIEENGYVYLVMDYIQGGTLADHVDPKRDGFLREGQLLDWGLQLCGVLYYLHRRRPPLIYRDLKPANILVDRDGNLFLSDFGLARTFKPDQARDTEALGTVATASPEHFSAQTDARSDVYSLGATLYLLASNGYKPKAPFNFPPIRSLNPALSAEFESFLSTCMQPQAEKRYGDTRQVAEVIHNILRLHGPSAMQEPEKTVPVVQPPRTDVRVPSQVQVVFTRQLLTLVKSGVPILQAIEVLRMQTEHPGLHAVLGEVQSKVLAGANLSAAMSFYPGVFPMLSVTMVRVGESTGGLVHCLEVLADWLERDARVLHRLQTSLTYPVIVVGITVVMTVLMFWVVLPNFVSIFEEMTIPLPWPTRVLMLITSLIRNPGAWLMGLALAALTLRLLRQRWKSEAGALQLFALCSRLPVLGQVLALTCLTRYCAAMEALLSSGVDLFRTLPLAATASGSPLLQQDARAAVRHIQGGGTLSEHLRMSELFPGLLAQMVQTGEETSRLPFMFNRCANFYDMEVTSQTDALGTALEPVLLLLIGCLIGFVMVGIFSPLYAYLGSLG